MAKLYCSEHKTEGVRGRYCPQCQVSNANKAELADELAAALQAIRARVNGVWDDPALTAWGALSPNSVQDVLEISKAALAHYDAQRQGG